LNKHHLFRGAGNQSLLY